MDIFLKKQGDEDLPEIYVTRRELKKYAESLYACEAGCIMKLEQLGSSETKFPIFLTSPPTPILYISHLKEHLELLQHTLHVRESLSHQEHYEKHYNKDRFQFNVRLLYHRLALLLKPKKVLCILLVVFWNWIFDISLHSDTNYLQRIFKLGIDSSAI